MGNRALRPRTGGPARLLGFVALLAGCLGGCARVPREAVELSTTVGRDLTEVHRANRALAQRYFARMYQDIDRFMTEVYRPFVIRFTMDSLDIVGEIQRATAPDSDLDPVDVMEVYADELLARIAAFREGLMTPIRAQEGEVLDSIDVAFQRLQRANAVVTGHLASVRRVHEVQDDLLRQLGAPGLRDKVAGNLASFSDNLAQILERGRTLDRLVGGTAEDLKAARDSLQTVLGSVRGLGRPEP